MNADAYLVCAKCGQRVEMGEVYADATMIHRDDGRHEVRFTAESTWIPEHGLPDVLRHEATGRSGDGF